jgi:GAF domain-containing protein
MSELLEHTHARQPGREHLYAVEGRPQPRRSGADAEFSAALADLALTVHVGVADPLTVITEGAVGLIPGTEFAAVVIPVGPGRLEARAVSGPVPPEVIALQNRVTVGPCIEAANQTNIVRINDLRSERRWPEFTAPAAEMGVGSMLCLPLTIQDRVYGSLSLAACAPHAFDAESEALAAIFAVHATIALAGDEWRRNMTTALSSRDVIGQAKGILMERYRLTPDAAFALLVKASQKTHTKLRLVCEELCQTGVLPVE